MKIFRLILCLIWLLPSLTFAGGMVHGRGSITSGDSYSDITFYWSAESTTADYSAGDSSATAESTVAISGTEPKVGSNSVKVTDSYDRYTFTAASIFPDLNEGRVGFWLYLDSGDTPASNDAFLSLYNSDEDQITLFYYTGAELRAEIKIGNGNRTRATTDAASMSTDTQYWIELSWDNNNDGDGCSFTAYVYSDSALVDSATDTTCSGSSWGATPIFNVGAHNAGCTSYIDQIYVSSDKDRDLWQLRNLTNAYPD